MVNWRGGGGCGESHPRLKDGGWARYTPYQGAISARDEEVQDQGGVGGVGVGDGEDHGARAGAVGQSIVYVAGCGARPGGYLGDGGDASCGAINGAADSGGANPPKSR